MVREGIPFVLIPLAIAIVLLAFGYWLPALVFGLLAAFVVFFFRNPHREVPTDSKLVVSAADGRVTRVEKVNPDDPNSPTLVSVFLSVFDVHINRAPIAGEITDITYTRGKFVIATRNDASTVNERNALTIKNELMTVVCTQIVGVVARRIVCWKKVGDAVGLGERFGLIKFGSRTDLLLPHNVEVAVKIGEKVRGGITIIGRVRDV